MINVSYVLGKFYPFHIGHKGLIQFAQLYHPHDEHAILVCGKLGDSIPTNVRYNAVQNYVGDSATVFTLNDPKMPDYPEDDPDFWEKWCKMISASLLYFGNKENVSLTFFTSEEYGEELAKQCLDRIARVVKCNHIPFNSDRDVFRASGTDCRRDVLGSWENIDHRIGLYLQKKYYIIGAESTGKTTFAEYIGNYFSHSVFVPEYARGYLNIKGTDLTEDKFEEIINGQLSQEQMPFTDAYIIYDTNLITTYGYAKLYYPDIASDMKDVFNFKDMYTGRNKKVLLMDDNIPFEPDAQRYGGNKRETNQQYWIDILNELDIPYVEIDRENPLKEFLNAFKTL